MQLPYYKLPDKYDQDDFVPHMRRRQPVAEPIKSPNRNNFKKDLDIQLHLPDLGENSKKASEMDGLGLGNHRPSLHSMDQDPSYRDKDQYTDSNPSSMGEVESDILNQSIKPTLMDSMNNTSNNLKIQIDPKAVKSR